MTKKKFDLKTHLERQIAWSEATFGPGMRTMGVIDHIRKELDEIKKDPWDVAEWIDVIILGFDGAWRAGYSADHIISALVKKMEKNYKREWPDWRTASPDKAIEHVRSRPVFLRTGDAWKDVKTGKTWVYDGCEWIIDRGENE